MIVHIVKDNKDEPVFHPLKFKLPLVFSFFPLRQL